MKRAFFTSVFLFLITCFLIAQSDYMLDINSGFIGVGVDNWYGEHQHVGLTIEDAGFEQQAFVVYGWQLQGDGLRMSVWNKLRSTDFILAMELTGVIQYRAGALMFGAGTYGDMTHKLIDFYIIARNELRVKNSIWFVVEFNLKVLTSTYYESTFGVHVGFIHRLNKNGLLK